MLHKGLFAAISLFALVAAACLPKPDDPIEWLHREDAVIVQLTTTPGFSAYDYRADLPDFTLYGDGTLIVSVESPSETTLVQATLSEDEIEGLLESIEDAGFFDFSYAQPEVLITDAGSAYLYVNSKLAANAVSAYALGADAPEGDEWDEFRKLAQIKERLDRMAEAALGGVTDAFVPERGRAHHRAALREPCGLRAMAVPADRRLTPRQRTGRRAPKALGE